MLDSYFFVEYTNVRLGSTFKILYFVGFSVIKNEWPFGYNCKISYFPVKKPLAVWVHALFSSSGSFGFYQTID